MRLLSRGGWAAGAILLLMAACAQSTEVAPTPGPGPEIAILDEPGGGYSIVGTRTGTTLRRLPAGQLAVALNGGGDIAEAYLAVPTASGGTEIQSVVPARAFAPATVAADPRPATAAVIAGAPNLSSFVGRQAVLVIGFDNGDLAGYQHGSPIWSRSVPGRQPGLLQLGQGLYTLQGGAWRSLAPDTGALGDPVTDCAPGPVGEAGGRLLIDCDGVLSVAGTRVPAGTPLSYPISGGSELLLFEGGELWRVDGASARRVGAVTRAIAPPSLSPDQATLYVPTAAGIEAINTRTGTLRVRRITGLRSLALSRDGNYLYVLGVTTFSTYSAASGARIGFFPVTASRIRLVAGG